MTGSPPKITVVGLGPGNVGMLTQATLAALNGGRVYLRTRVHPTLPAIPGSSEWPSFDHLYDSASSFAQLYETIVDSLLKEASEGPLVYAVPGHPLVGESTALRLIERAKALDIEVQVIPAVSFIDAAICSIPTDPLATNLQIVDALALVAAHEREPFGGGLLPISALQPAIVAQIHNRVVASATKIALLRRYPADHQVTLLRAVGTPDEEVITMQLFELDHQIVDHLTTVYLPAVDPLSVGRESNALQRVVARLRAPNGCPWDREQTHESLAPHLIEEAYEVVEAIERQDLAELEEELGDLLLQVYLHAQLAEETGDFVLEDVFEGIVAKLVRRHPHVFGSAVAESASDVLSRWDEIKRTERTAKSATRVNAPLGTIPKTMPALARAQTVIRRAERNRDLRDNMLLEACRNLARQLGNQIDFSSPDDLARALAATVYLASEGEIDAEQSLRSWTIDLESGLVNENRKLITGRFEIDKAQAGTFRDDVRVSKENTWSVVRHRQSNDGQACEPIGPAMNFVSTTRARQ